MTDTNPTSGQTIRKVTLEKLIMRGETKIETVDLRKPGSGELRGLTLMGLSQLDYAALETLLPRITMPTLTKADVAALDPADLMQFGIEVVDFLLPKSAKPDSLAS